MSGCNARRVWLWLIGIVLLSISSASADSLRLSVPFSPIKISADRGELKAAVDPDFYGEAKGVVDHWRMELPLPDAAPVILDLERFEVVAPDARFLIGSSDGDSPLAQPEVVTCRGTVEDRPGSFAYLAVSSSGLTNGYVDPGAGHNYLLGTLPEDLKTGSEVLTVGRATAFSQDDLPFCGFVGDTALQVEPEAGEVMAPALNAGPFLQRLAIDADQAFVNLFPSIYQARDYIVQLMGAVSSIYERDVNVRMTLAFVRLWPDGGALFNVNDLEGFREYWWQREDTTGLNIVHLFSGEAPLAYGGVAYLTNTCGGSSYGICGRMNGGFPAPVESLHIENWDLFVVAHEMGHNHRAHHTHDSYFSPTIDDCGNGIPSLGTIMSYCHSGQPGGSMNVDLRFHRRVQEEIAQNVWTAGCHDRDCNGNGIGDDDDIAQGISADVNSDGIPDECQDCNGNGTLDPEEIAGGAPDFDGNGIPDECEEDCNANNIPDQYETWTGPADDVDGNNVPDECDPDCDNNGVVDYVDINLNMSRDLDRNRILDECQDCLGNGFPDWVDAGRSQFLYVCDPGNSQLKEYHPDAGIVDRAWSPGSGQLNDIMASHDGAWLYAADSATGVLRIDPSTGAAGVFVANGSGELTTALALCFGPGGDLLVADYSGNAVRRYDTATGAYIADFVPSGSSPLTAPSSLIYSPSGNLFVGGTDAVYEFHGTSGDYLGQFVSSGAGGLDGTRGMLFKDDGNLLVSSYNSGEVLEFDGSTGAYVGVFNDPTFAVSEPWGLRVGLDGRILLSCRGAGGVGRILAYEPATGHYQYIYIRNTLTAPRGFVFLPATATDVNGNMIPDACESGDADSDGIADVADNCPNEPNSGQVDSDGDGFGDACDNCPTVANTDQRNGDGDSFGDDCDNCPAVTNTAQVDSDGDGHGDGCDNCPEVINPDQVDYDGDFAGDWCDRCPDQRDYLDLDWDGAPDSCDNCLTTPNADQADSDDDELGDLCDNCPEVYNPGQEDGDDNGIGDACQGCCLAPTVGDVDQSGVVDITDVSVLIDNQFLTLAPLICEDEGDCDLSGVVDITDVSVLIDNQFLTLTPLPPCP